jgi:hypothetical protein
MSFQNLIVRQALKALHNKAKKDFPKVDCIRISQDTTEKKNFVAYYENRKEVFLSNYDFGNFANSFKILLGEKGIKVDEILSLDLLIFYSEAIQTDCTIQYILNGKKEFQKLSFIW